MSSTTGAEAGRGALAGKSALVTGASRGIGAACARALHAAGATVLVLARTTADLERLAREFGPGAHPVPCDLADPDEVRRAVADVRAILGAAPDVLVANAARFVVSGAHATTPAQFEEILRINLISHFTLLSAFLPELRDRGSGHVVSIGSIADRVGYAGNSAYAASKFGARGLHEVLRTELRGTGVRTTLVSPGPVDTPIWNDVRPEHREGHTPRERMLDAEAVADAVLFAVTRPTTTNVDELRLSRA